MIEHGFESTTLDQTESSLFKETKRMEWRIELLNQLETDIGYTFRNKALLYHAATPTCKPSPAFDM
jgi:hypothetical protein